MNSFKSERRKQHASPTTLNPPASFGVTTERTPPTPQEQGIAGLHAGHSLADFTIHHTSESSPATPLQRVEAAQSQGQSERPEQAPSEERPENQTGLPDSLKAGVESLSGYSLDNIRIHYNSPKPTEVSALAYTQGTEIHVGPGQEQHLAHEAWHVVQQKQGRVQATMQMKGVAINDDQGLEREADVMGNMAKTVQRKALPLSDPSIAKEQRRDFAANDSLAGASSHTIQRMMPAAKKQKKISQAALNNVIKDEQEEQDWDYATGHMGSGQWTEEVTVRAPYSFEEQRVRQVLRHLSTAVYFYVKAQVDKEQEVQAMYVNNRLLFSSNLPASMAQLRNLGSQEIFDIFLSCEYVPDSEKRALGDIDKLRALIGGDRLENMDISDEDAEALAAIKEMVISAINEPDNYFLQCSLATAPKYITDDEYENSIIFVKGDNPVHAEQNLILAYYQSGTKQAGLIYGKKRPCTGCYLTFAYAVKVLKCNLTYSEKPGGFWKPAVKGLWKLIISQKGPAKIEDVEDFVEKNLPAMTNRTQRTGAEQDDDYTKERGNQKGEETGYDSPSDSEAEDVEDFDLSDLE